MKRYWPAGTALAFAAAAVLCIWTVSAWGQVGKERSALRAFYTAPPVIPHEIADERDASSCLMCHQGVMNLGDRTTMPTPHPQFHNCMQCHLRSVVPTWMKSHSAATSWRGLEEPRKGTRAHEFAPPTIPHRLFLRSNCIPCHAGDHPNAAVRSPHPERFNCRQCHVAGPATEFRAAPGPGGRR